MAPRPNVRSLAVLAAAVALAGCSSRRDEGLREQVFSAGRAPEQAPALDPARPLQALHASADEAASRAGSFAWEAQVTWSVQKAGAAPQQASERHRLRQLATGDFEVDLDLDPGKGPGSETGKQLVYAKGMTYARGRWAPFRERPTDHGRDARRYRDESFRMAAELADLYGRAFRAQPAGDATFLGRAAHRYVLSSSGDAPGQAAPPPGLPDGGFDPDTRRRVDFLEGRVPTALEGELLLDAETSLPLSVTMRGSFSERADPEVHVAFTLDAQVKALGDAVPAVAPPSGALADERKPKGVARALEAAGLRKRAAGERGEGDEERGAEQGE